MRAVVVALAVLLLVSGCRSAQPSTAVSLPPLAAPVDYQLGGAYEPPTGVAIVVRDSTAEPADDLYSICYVNGFQTQPAEEWPADLVVHADGEPLADPNWPDEFVLDISSEASRDGILDRMRVALDRCAGAGFDAVEFDNLDSYTRSEGLLTRNDALAFATLLVEEAHERGLAAGQKNAADLAAVGAGEIGFDFVITEECDRFEECDVYRDAYGDHVINIEYSDDLRRSFAEICADSATPASTVLRDRMLVLPSDPEYVFERC